MRRAGETVRRRISQEGKRRRGGESRRAHGGGARRGAEQGAPPSVDSREEARGPVDGSSRYSAAQPPVASSPSPSRLTFPPILELLSKFPFPMQQWPDFVPQACRQRWQSRWAWTPSPPAALPPGIHDDRAPDQCYLALRLPETIITAHRGWLCASCAVAAVSVPAPAEAAVDWHKTRRRTPGGSAVAASNRAGSSGLTSVSRRHSSTGAAVRSARHSATSSAGLGCQAPIPHASFSK